MCYKYIIIIIIIIINVFIHEYFYKDLRLAR